MAASKRYTSRAYPTPALSDCTVRSAVSGISVRLESFRSPPGIYDTARFEGHRVVTNLANTSLPLKITLLDDAAATESIAESTAQVSIRLHPGETLLMRGLTRSCWNWARTADCLIATVPPGAIAELSGSTGRTVRLRDGAQLHKLGVRLGPIAQALAEAQSESSFTPDAYLSSLVEAYLAGVLRAFANAASSALANAHTAFDASDPLLAVCGTRFESLLPRLREARLRSVTVRELADAAQLSCAQFSRDFKAVVGIAPSALIRAHRIHLAMYLLRDTTMPLAEIALEAGYSDQSHMSRAVKAVHGKTPLGVRAKD